MHDKAKTKNQLIGELRALRQHNAELAEALAQQLQQRPQRPDSPINQILGKHLSEANKARVFREQQFQSLSATAPVGIFQTDRAGAGVYVNQRWLQMAGLSEEMALGFGWLQAVHPEDWEHVFTEWQAHAQAGHDFSREFRFLWSDGEVRWVRACTTPLYSSSGQVIGHIGTTEDVTTRKKAEGDLHKIHAELEQRVQTRTAELERLNAALQASEKRYHIVSDLATDYALAARVEPDGQLVFEWVTKAFTRLTGYTLEEINEHGWQCVWLPEDFHKGQEILQQLLANQALSGEFRFRTKSGDIGMVYASHRPEWDESQGRVVRLYSAGQDITQQKQAEEALKKSEERWQLAARASNDAIWELETKTWRIYYSPRWKDMLGFGEDEISDTMEEWQRRMHPDDLEQVWRTLREHMTSSSPFQIEFRMQCKDQTYKWILARVIVECDADGVPTRAIGTNTDITERRQAEEVLKTQAAILERMAEGANMVDESGILFYTNPAFDAMFGYARGELTGQHVSILNAGSVQDANNTAASIMAALQQQPTWQGELTNVKKDGTQFSTSAHVSQLQLEDKLFLVTVQRDLTASKQAEQALKQSEERFRSHYKHNPVPIYTWQRQNTDFVLVDYNDAAETISKGNISSLLGQRSQEFFADEPQMQDDLLTCFRTQSPLTREAPFALKSTGQKKYLVVTCTYIPPDCVSVHTIDITERKRTEEQLKRSLHEKEVLLREIHHRVKNNLQIISSLLHLQAKTTDNEATQQLLAESQNRVRSMALIHEKLYQTDNFSLINFPWYIQQLARHLWKSYQVRADRVQMQVKVDDLSLSLDQAVPCGLILTELLSNALKYAFPDEKKGEVVIELKRTCDGQQAVLAVRDTGVGLPAGLDSRPQRLGLYLVQRLSHQLQGDLDVQSQVGTRFQLTFPLEGAQAVFPTEENVPGFL